MPKTNPFSIRLSPAARAALNRILAAEWQAEQRGEIVKAANAAQIIDKAIIAYELQLEAMRSDGTLRTSLMRAQKRCKEIENERTGRASK